MVTPDLKLALSSIWADAEAQRFAGWDPYDGLNSRFFRATPFYHIPFGRQAWIQLVKRSPLNLRPVFGQSPEVLSKGLSLFALGAWTLASGQDADAAAWRERGRRLLEQLETLRSPGFEMRCWGYPYDWQSRAFFQPKNAPNLICSVFAAMAFERRTDGGDALSVPSDVARFIREQLHRVDEAGSEWITYTPTTNTQVHNVNMLGAALLARQARSGEPDPALTALAERAMRTSTDLLDANGSWPYGEAPNQAWVDNFHTGYNLSALMDYRKTTGEKWVDPILKKAYTYWDRNFFGADGLPYYYDTNHWPVDIHCCAQAILTYLECRPIDPSGLSKAGRVAEWTFQNMWDGQSRFIFQKGPRWTNRVPQIRWGQAWMFRALAELYAAGGSATRRLP